MVTWLLKFWWDLTDPVRMRFWILMLAHHRHRCPRCRMVIATDLTFGDMCPAGRQIFETGLPAFARKVARMTRSHPPTVL